MTVSWREPKHVNGEIIGFRIRYQKLRNLDGTSSKNRRSLDQFIYVAKNYSVPGEPTLDERTHIIDNLSPYAEYIFQVQELTVAWGPYSDSITNATKQGSKLCLNYQVYSLV